MKQKMFLTAVALVLLFLSASPTRAGEITVNWRTMTDSNITSDSSKIYDLEFMPGQESFIIVTGSSLQVRSCEDGSVIKSVPIPYIGAAHNIEFTPDSTKLILAFADKIEVREIENFSIINSYTIPKDEEEFSVRFYEMKVDPVRPYIYTIRNRQKNVNGNLVHFRKVMIFDRETLNPVGELTTTEDEELLLVNLAVSKDGKYLAVMNEGKSKLMVWSLDSRQKIVDKYISDQNSDKFSDPADVKFSELNSDKIFFSGQFYQEFGKETFNGLCIFSINQNRIIDSTFALTKEYYAGPMNIVFFENEMKILGMANGFLRILDYALMKKEFEKSNDDLGIPSAYNAIYNKESKFFIGTSSRTISKFQYQPNTGIPENNPNVVIYPNPTTGIVNITMNCVSTSKYEIFNSSGKLIKSSILPGVSGNLFTIDFTQYPVGVYSIKFYCGKEVEQYQVVRGE